MFYLCLLCVFHPPSKMPVRIGQATMLVDSFADNRESIESQLEKAIVAIKQFALKKEQAINESNGTLDLITPDAESFTLNFSLNKIPVKKDFRFNEILVPHPVIDDIAQKSLCMLVRDPKETAVKSIAAENLTFEKVISIKSLKKKYVSHESRRELANRFDLFFCEESIFELMGKLLGKYFFETKKSKIPLTMKSITKKSFEKCIRTCRFRVRGGAVVGVKFGTRTMDTQQLIENGMAVITHMANVFCTDKKTYNNIFNIMVNATNVIGLPVWSVPVAQEVAQEVAQDVSITTKTPTSTVQSKKSLAKPLSKLAAPDMAAVPVKDLKAAQKQRVAVAKSQMASDAPPKRARK